MTRIHKSVGLVLIKSLQSPLGDLLIRSINSIGFHTIREIRVIRGQLLISDDADGIPTSTK